MKYFIIVLTLIISNQSFGDWTPPEKIDLRQILNSAYEDKRNKNYKDALAKHIWFHENSLKIDRSYYGVRLSFAMSDWVELSQVYPPALEALEEQSEKAEQSVKDKNKCCNGAFHDYVSINRELNRENKIVGLFKWLDSNNPIAAKRSYDIAQPTLVIQREYLLCSKYINPQEDFNKLKEIYEINIKMVNEPKLGARMQSFADESFVNGITTLIGILAISGRNDEASNIAEQSLEIMKGESYEAELNSALNGKVPLPFGHKR